MSIVRVVADVPAIDREFDYILPAELEAMVEIGSIVRISLHGRRVRGWVVALGVHSDVPASRLRSVVSVSSAGPPADVVSLCMWSARRFVGSPIALLRSASPPNNVAPNSIGPVIAMAPGTLPPGPTTEIVDPARPVVWWPPLADRRAQVASMLATDGSSIVVTSDPARADALVDTLRRHGWPAIAWHSDLPAAARADAWRRAARGGCVVVGGRTAVFAPVPDLRACVLVDDLDEALQEERQPTWHARVVIAERARRLGASSAVVSPLPSVAAIEAATSVLEPPADVSNAGWPRIDVVNLADEAPGTGLLSAPLSAALRATVDRGFLALCLVNRRGRARLLYCPECRELSRWDREGSPLIDEQDRSIAIGARPTVCLHCGRPRPRLLRSGVDRLGDDISALLGDSVRVGVVDAAVFEPDPDAGVLVGTESLLHRRDIRRRRPALVALLDFDQELFAPRLRADEQALWLVARSAQILAGRTRSESRLMLQTYTPSHPLVAAIASSRFVDAQRVDAAERTARRLPPACAQALLSGDVPAVDAAVSGLRLMLADTVTIKGPSGAGTKRRALVEHPDIDRLTGALADIAAGARLEGRLRIEMDPSRA
jgi:primosomal protein N' (replication factor Y)